MITKVFQHLDLQMVFLNVTSVGSIVAESMASDSNRWAIGFLIITVGILNLAKAYSTIKKSSEDEKTK